MNPSLEKLSLFVLLTAAGIRVLEWALKELWSRVSKKETEQDQKDSSLSATLKDVAAEMRVGFNRVEQLIHVQNVAQAETNVRLLHAEKELERQAKRNHYYRDLLFNLCLKTGVNPSVESDPDK